MSRKFTTAQQNYAVHELETLAILEALLKWEDKLMGYNIHIITDHKALEFFKTQDDVHDVHDFVQADKRIDPEGEDLPLHRFQEIVEHQVEIQAMQACEVRRSKWLKEQLELRDLEAQHMLEVPMVGAQPVGELLSNDDNPLVAQVLGKGTDSASDQDHDEVHLHVHIRQGYLWDKMFVEILNRPREHS
ncbi:hypothetical protein C0995_005989 [Termitomyces sp. Mi166|nr:hypothetical protein C0995_005989 [Termitomyces sp. Mi166\